MSSLRGVVLSLVAALVVLAVPAATTSATAADDPAPTITVQTSGSLAQYRDVGVRVQGANLVAEAVTVALDGVAVDEIPVPAGTSTVDEVVKFPTITEGSHTIALVRGEDTVLASQEVTVLPASFTVTASPTWITAEKLSTDGVRLRATGLTPETRVTGRLGGRTVVGTVDGSGVAEVTITRGEDATLAQPGPHAASLQLGDETGPTASTTVRTTVLDVVSKGTGGAVIGTGFEPRTEVTMDDGSRTTTGRSDDDGRVEIPTAPGTLRPITLSGTAGSVTRELNPSFPEGLDPAALEQVDTQGELARLMLQLAATQRDTARDFRANARDQEVADALRKAAEAQVETRDALLGTSVQSQGLTAVAGGIGRIDSAAQETKLLAAARAEQSAVKTKLDQATAEQAKQLTPAARDIEAWVASIEATQKDLAEQERLQVLSSTPRLLADGPRPEGEVTVSIPADFRGLHHYGVIDPESGVVTAWVPIEVTAADAGDGGSGDGGSTGGVTAALPDTGATVQPALLAVGACLLLAGGATLVARRRRSA